MRDERLSKRGRPTDPTGRPVEAASRARAHRAAAAAVTFERLNRWDWVAFVAALVLLFVMAVDWYSTVQGEEARRIERIEDPNPGASGQIGREVEERAAERAEGAERNALQPQSLIDALLLVCCSSPRSRSPGVAAFARAAGRRFDPPGHAQRRRGGDGGDRGAARGLPDRAAAGLGHRHHRQGRRVPLALVVLG